MSLEKKNLSLGGNSLSLRERSVGLEGKILKCQLLSIALHTHCPVCEFKLSICLSLAEILSLDRLEFCQKSVKKEPSPSPLQPHQLRTDLSLFITKGI